MEIDTARKIVRTALDGSATLRSLLPILKEQCTHEEYKDYARAVARAIDAIGVNLLNKTMDANPQIRAEVEESIAATGRYR